MILYHKKSIKQIECENKVWFFLHFFAFLDIIDYVLYVINLSMKKVFVQFRQWILKYRKRLIYGVFALFVGQICFFGVKWLGVENCVFAADGQTQEQKTAEKKLEEWEKSLLFVNKTVYVLIYPVLALAWKLVDNSLVYWEVFGFDAVLWKLWNIVKNLANFTLWFIFLFKIFKYLIDWKEKVKDIILKALIAWIWIQASWFIMATLIDASTILTYWVWWLPITMLKDSSNFIEQQRTKYNPYVLKNVISLDAKNFDEFYIYQTNILWTWEYEKEWKFYISECRTITYGDTWYSEDLILAPKIIYYQVSTGNFRPTDAKRCHYYGQVYYFSDLSDKIVKDEKGRFPRGENEEKFQNCWNEKDCTDKQNEYRAILKEVWDNYVKSNTWKTEVATLIANGKILEIWDAHMTWGIFWSVFTDIPVYGEDQHRGLDVDNKWTGEWDKTTKLQGILGGDSYVGVFTALYSSLMERWRNVIPAASNAWMFVKVLNTALSVWFLFAIWIPLIVVAVVFLMRIWILWVAISLSPFIVLLTAFDLFNSKWVGKIKFLEYFKVENLIPIVFSPAVVCFAVSLATVLVTIIQDMNVEFDKILWSTTILWWLVEVSFAWFPMKIAEFINLLLWVAITWFILWTAVEASKLWEAKFIQSLKNLANTALWSMPIIPVPWKDGETKYIGAATAFGLNGQDWMISKIWQQIKSKYDTEDNKALQELINPETAKEKAQTNAKSNRLNEYMNGLDNAKIDAQWKSNYKIETTDVLGSGATNFNTLDDAQKEKVIEKINSMSLEQREKFGEATPSITISDKTRTFEKTDKEGKILNKFVKKESESK